MNDLKIRKAKISDAFGIANVHIESWKETYSKIIPDEYLSSLSKIDRQKMWEQIIQENKLGQYLFVAIVGGNIVGFVSGGKAREIEYGQEGELYAIYLLKIFHGKGMGAALFMKLVDSFKRNPIKGMYLWVLKDNATLKFYEKMGGIRGLEREDEIGGKKVMEVLYYWNEFKLGDK
jgi:ribosomal protein S18 acetylase RimI-like enzyme